MSRRERDTDDRRRAAIRPCTTGQRKMIEENIGIAVAMCRYYSSHRQLGDEAMSIALMTLVECSQTWEPDRVNGRSFSSYVGLRVKGELSKALKAVRHLRGYGERPEGVQVKCLDPTSPTKSSEVVADVVDHRTYRDVDVEDEVCWLLSLLKPHQVAYLRLRFWEDVGATELAARYGVNRKSVFKKYAGLLPCLRETLFSSYRGKS